MVLSSQPEIVSARLGGRVAAEEPEGAAALPEELRSARQAGAVQQLITHVIS